MPTHKERNLATRQLSVLLALSVIVAAVLGYLWFTLSSLPPLEIYGYPKSVEEVDQPEEVLEFLQTYNRAIVKIGQTLYWLILLMFLIVLQLITPFLTCCIIERRRRAGNSDE